MSRCIFYLKVVFYVNFAVIISWGVTCRFFLCEGGFISAVIISCEGILKIFSLKVVNLELIKSSMKQHINTN